MAISIYTELDSLWDTRRMILHRLAEEHGVKDFHWDKHFSKVYQRRKYDVFEFPEFGFSQQSVLERYLKRSTNDWASERMIYAIPTRLIYHMFQIVRELEFGVGKLLSVDTFQLSVNTFPYQLKPEELEYLSNSIKGAVKFGIELNFVHVSPEQLDHSYLHQFGYVFKYDILHESSGMKDYWNNKWNWPNTSVKFIVPEVLGGKGSLSGELEGKSLKEIISLLNISLGGKITLVAVDKNVYDYIG